MRPCISLSNATIFFSSAIRYFFNFNVPHPLKDGAGVLVDYNVATLMLPMIIVGAALGVVVNEVLNKLVITIIYTAVLAFVFVTTTLKFLNARKAETAKFKAAAAALKATEKKMELETKEDLINDTNQATERDEKDKPELVSADLPQENKQVVVQSIQIKELPTNSKEDPLNKSL